MGLSPQSVGLHTLPCSCGGCEPPRARCSPGRVPVLMAAWGCWMLNSLGHVISSPRSGPLVLPLCPAFTHAAAENPPGSLGCSHHNPWTEFLTAYTPVWSKLSCCFVFLATGLKDISATFFKVSAVCHPFLVPHIQ